MKTNFRKQNSFSPDIGPTYRNTKTLPYYRYPFSKSKHSMYYGLSWARKNRVAQNRQRLRHYILENIILLVYFRNIRKFRQQPPNATILSLDISLSVHNYNVGTLLPYPQWKLYLIRDPSSPSEDRTTFTNSPYSPIPWQLIIWHCSPPYFNMVYCTHPRMVTHSRLRNTSLQKSSTANPAPNYELFLCLYFSNW